MLYIASDHGGFKLKEEIKEFLSTQGFTFEDLGAMQLDPTDDYPSFATRVATKVSTSPDKDRGILLCRSGQGVNIVANKFPHVRAALVWNAKEAIASRTDDLSNILSLPSDYVSSEDAREIVQAWLDTPLGTAERHLKRVNQITQLEEELYK